MNKTLKLLFAGLLLTMFAVFAVACGEDPDDTDSGGDGDADGDTDTDTDADADADMSPVSPIDTLVGMTYLVEFDKGYWTLPNKSIGEQMGANVPPFIFQFKTVTAVDSQNATFTAILGTADDTGSQDTCAKTYEVTGTLTSDASTTFVFDPIDIDAFITGNLDANNLPMQLVAPIYNFSIGGTFVNQGARFKSGTMDAYMDIRDIYCLFTILSAPTSDTICSMMSSDYLYDCESCAYSGATTGNYCITLGASTFRINALESGTDVVAVSDFDMTCINDSTCAK